MVRPSICFPLLLCSTSSPFSAFCPVPLQHTLAPNLFLLPPSFARVVLLYSTVLWCRRQVHWKPPRQAAKKHVERPQPPENKGQEEVSQLSAPASPSRPAPTTARMTPHTHTHTRTHTLDYCVAVLCTLQTSIEKHQHLNSDGGTQQTVTSAQRAPA